MDVAYRTRTVDEVELFYREAGPSDAPVILLLHGFPTAGHMFRDLIPLLADRFRVIAPDLPGFGNTVAPARGSFDYSFDTLARIVGRFTEVLGLERYALYLFDYGAPTGFRLAIAHPERVSAIISQNGNAYLEGLSDGWGPWQRYWREPTQENREACRVSLAPDTIREWQYFNGSDRSLVSPDGYTLDIAHLARPGAEEIQLDLILDYRSNVNLYPDFQSYFRAHRPPFLAAWGRNDAHFLPEGAEAYRRDLPDAEIHLLEAGHFALETHHSEIAALIRDFLARHLAGDLLTKEDIAGAPSPDSGIVETASPFDFASTLYRVTKAIEAAGLLVVARIDHAEAAREASLSMPPTVVLVYGHATGGTPIMLAAPGSALDLPLRVVVRENNGRAIVSFRPIAPVLRAWSVPDGLASRLDPAQRLIVEALKP